MNRKIDYLGRIVIPKEMRKQLGINDGDPVHIELIKNQIILTKPGKKPAEEKIAAAIELIYKKMKDVDIYGEQKLNLNDLLNILNGE